jgi:hypothetical protein
MVRMSEFDPTAFRDGDESWPSAALEDDDPDSLSGPRPAMLRRRGA